MNGWNSKKTLRNSVPGRDGAEGDRKRNPVWNFTCVNLRSQAKGLFRQSVDKAAVNLGGPPGEISGDDLRLLPVRRKKGHGEEIQISLMDGAGHPEPLSVWENFGGDFVLPPQAGKKGNPLAYDIVPQGGGERLLEVFRRFPPQSGQNIAAILFRQLSARPQLAHRSGKGEVVGYASIRTDFRNIFQR